MGKGELWDDSVLINAFHEAISTYKKMHGKDAEQSGNGGFAIADVDSTGEDASATTTIDASLEDASHAQTLDCARDGSNTMLRVEDVDNSRKSEGNEDDQEVPEKHTFESNGLPSQDHFQNQCSSLDVDEYNQLYYQYYEVEEQRQKILQKLQNFGGWTSSFPGDASASAWQWGSNSADQEYQPSDSQVPGETTVASCCPCACQCSVVSCCSQPCPSTGACAFIPSGGHSVMIGLEKKTSVEGVDLVKTAMGAAEKAISTLKENTSDWKEENRTHSGLESSSSSETDLSVVFNAWYSAGFYTGKYLTEKSFAKKRHG